ncbi:MAG TPA: PEP-CTERM sorting domain-containing protein [Candidatus Acidoferrum sp.]|nr:PEP-CTERM sorting domain-containing protein [Candidatus Acidoferrum sp.]
MASTCLLDLGVVVNVLSGGTLNNEGPHGYDGTLLNEGTLANGGTINNYCIFGLNGNLCNGGSAQDTIYNALSTLINNGEINGGVILNTGEIDNLPGATFSQITLTNEVDGTVKNVGGIEIPYVNSAMTSINNGTIENFAGGTIEIDNENALPGVLTNNGTLLNDAGAAITSSGLLTNSAGATFTNNGTFIASTYMNTNNIYTNDMILGSFTNYGTFTNNGTLDGQGTVAIVSNYGTFNSNGAASVLLQNYGQVTNGASGTMGIGGIGQTSANSGTLTNNGQLYIEDTLNNFGQLKNSGTLNIEGGFLTIEPGGSVVNNGSIVVNPDFGDGGIIIGPGAMLTNAAGSSFMQIEGSTVVYGTMNTVPEVQLVGGDLLGTGRINGNVSNAGGIVEPGVQPANVGGLVPGTLTINGSYTQGSGGELAIELLDAAAGDFSVLDVSGLVTLDGIVDFSAYPGFDPQVGEDFVFLLGESISGEFASIDVEGWSCPIEDTCFVVYGDNSVSLDIEANTSGEGGSIESREVRGGGGGTATPEPSTFALLGMGALVFAFARYKRRGLAGSVAA